MSVIDKIDKKNSDDVKVTFLNIMNKYLNPAFGSMSKRDFDIFLFMELQKLGVIETNPNIYNLVSELKVTRSKARSLLYEAKLRISSENDLNEELKNLLQNPVFLKDNDKIGIEIDNPYLIDFLRFKLKNLNYITDGSFSPELVKLSVDAYLSVFETYLSDSDKSKVVDSLVKLGAKGDNSFKGVMKAALKKLGTKVADNAGGEVAESVSDYLGPLLNGGIDEVKDKIKTLLD